MPERERKKVGERYDEILRTGCREYRELCPSLFERLMLSASGRLPDCAQAYSLDFEEMRSRKGEMPDDGLGEDDCKSLQKDINTLIRLMAGKEHCLLFLSDYSIPPHNNDSEKSARHVKVHAKPNGGMRSEEYVGYYADTASVLETEHLKGRSRFGKLKEVFKRGTWAREEN